MELARKGFQDLKELTMQRALDDTEHYSSLSELVKSANVLRRSKRFHIFILSSLPGKAGKHAKQILSEVGFLGRIPSALKVFLQVSQRFPSFRRLSIKPSETTRQPELIKHSGEMLTLERTLDCVDKQFKRSTVTKFVSKHLSVPKATTKFMKLQCRPLPTHAEVQMILYFLKQGVAFDDVFQYLGCSKLSCFMCHQFLRHCSGFETRGCHKELYPAWTVAPVYDITPKSVDLLRNTLSKIQDELTDIIREPISQSETHKTKESSFGLTSNRSQHTTNPLDLSLSSMHISWYALESQRSRATEHENLSRFLAGSVPACYQSS